MPAEPVTKRPGWQVCKRGRLRGKILDGLVLMRQVLPSGPRGNDWAFSWGADCAFKVVREKGFSWRTILRDDVILAAPGVQSNIAASVYRPTRRARMCSVYRRFHSTLG